MKKVLVRFYGSRNLGDDLFIKVLSERYRNKFTVIDYVSNPSFRELSNVHAITNRFLLYMFRLLDILFKTRNSILLFFSRSHDLLIYVGGSIFIEGSERSVWSKELTFYERLKIPYYIIGSNIGPYRTKGFLSIIREIFSNAKDVCLRDSTSHSLVEDISNVRLSTDAVFAMDVERYKNDSEKIITFSIVNYRERFDKETADTYEKILVNLTCKYMDDGYKVVYMSFCNFEGDKIAIKYLLSSMSVEMSSRIDVFYYDGNIDEALALLARSEIIMAGRFHAVILGLLFEKTVLPMAYSNKTINLLKDIDFHGPVLDIRKADKFRLSTLEQMQHNNISEQIKLATQQFSELDKVLSRRDG